MKENKERQKRVDDLQKQVTDLTVKFSTSDQGGKRGRLDSIDMIYAKEASEMRKMEFKAANELSLR